MTTAAHAVVPLEPHHWPAVRAIHAEGIATGMATFETEPPSWEQWDAGHHAHTRFVAMHGGRVEGWAALAPVSARAAYAGVAEVSVYVAAAARGGGVGRTLLDAVVAASEENGIWTLQAGILPENTASLALHARCGFRIVGRRHRIARLGGAWRDVVLLERRSAHPPFA